MSSDRLDAIHELLQGADDVFEPELRADMEWLLSEVERLRAKNTELNRRANTAEGHVSTTIEDCRRQGVSLGRGLANAGYVSMRAERDRLHEALDAEERHHNETSARFQQTASRLESERDEALSEAQRLREEVTALGDTLDEVDAERRAWDSEASRLRAGIKTHRDRWDDDQWDHLPASRDLWALIEDPA